MVACWMPARRTAWVDVARLLRAEYGGWPVLGEMAITSEYPKREANLGELRIISGCSAGRQNVLRFTVAQPCGTHLFLQKATKRTKGHGLCHLRYLL
jgi:hypothetical protein